MRFSQRTGFLSLILSLSLLSDVATASPSRADTPFLPPQIPLNGPSSHPDKLEFTLRHVYHQGINRSQHLHRRIDVRPDTRLMVIAEDGPDEQPYDPTVAFAVSSKPLTIQRLADRRVSVMQEHLRTAWSSGSVASLSPSAWVMDTVEGPNVSDKETILNFAKMTANDYIEVPGTEDWHDIHGRFNYSNSFGWASDGLRGHIYADKTNDTIVISLKGTSAALFDGEGTTTNDKENDNLFFSCCCGQGGSYLWRQVCDCQASAFTANLTCIVEALTDETRYYKMAIDLYANITELYPHANIWLTGHSLGGAMASLLGQTFGLPVVTYEAVPEALPAARLGLPAPPGYDPLLPQSRRYTGVYHIGHTADPVYMGTCNGVGSVCTWGGYAMESACHSGEMCVYDTVEDKGWRVAIGTHRIRAVITDVIEKYDEVPACAREEECFDCQLWKFFRSNGSEVTTTRARTTTTSRTTTRSTSTCKTPGWWGCLDETTTTGTTTTTSPTSTSTTTCKTPGWFGCKDSTTSYRTPTAKPAPPITTTVPTATSTSCLTPGWLGCRDHTATKTRTQSTPQVTSTCATPGILFGCRDSSTRTPTITSLPTSRPSSATSTRRDSHTCTSKAFFGLICLGRT